jgi:hypothetical protein
LKFRLPSWDRRGGAKRRGGSPIEKLRTSIPVRSRLARADPGKDTSRLFLERSSRFLFRILRSIRKVVPLQPESFAQHEKFFTQHRELWSQQEKFFTQHRKLWSQHEKFFAQHRKLWPEHEKFFAQQEKPVVYRVNPPLYSANPGFYRRRQEVWAEGSDATAEGLRKVPEAGVVSLQLEHE